MLGRALSLSLLVVATTVASSTAQTLDLTGDSSRIQLPSSALLRTLAKPVRFPGINAPGTTVRTALEELAERYDVVFDINEAAFKNEGIMDILECMITRMPIPPMQEANLATVIQTVVQRIPATSGATFIIRRDVIEVTAREAAILEGWQRVRQDWFLIRCDYRSLMRVIKEGYSLQECLYQTREVAGRLANLVYWSDVVYTNARTLSADLRRKPLQK